MTFEFLVVLGAVLVLTTSIFNDFANQTTDTAVQNLVKDITLQKLASKINTDPTCVGGYLKSMKTAEGSITLDIEGCDSLSMIEIADTVENTLCKNFVSDSVVVCGEKGYELIKQ